MGSNIFHIWFYRLHNVVAANLEKINPCWDDNKIFYTTREILIAGYLQIYYYQFLPLLFGMERLIKDGVISKHKGYRDVYDEKIIPQMSDEYSYVLRWFHIAQEATLELYDENYKCFKTFPMVNLTTRTAYFPENDHEAQIARGSFLQSTSKFMDHAVDPDISEVGLGGLQYAFDITAADVAKGRLFGFAPYVDYLEVCRKKKFKTFKDLLEVMDEDRIKRLRRVYKCAQDVDLMPGLWSERKIKDGSVPGTLYCLMAEQLLRSIKSDRHWYERRNRPYAFTPEQLSQIRNSNMGKLLCRVAPGITKITKNPFLVRSERNKMVSCDELPEVDFNAWKECKQ
uniref:Peroxidase n=3 Tax=Bombyx mori TaxID=7091 RepID=A0A8R1WJM5_BOMMO|nr:peroxidase [Bombyx mori]